VMTGMRVSLDPGQIGVPGWLDLARTKPGTADLRAGAFDFIAEHGADVSDLFLGRLLEDLTPDDGLSLLRLIGTRTSPGTKVFAVAADVRRACEALTRGQITTDSFNRLLVHAGDSHVEQLWSFDGPTLTDLFRAAGFEAVVEPDPLLPEGAVLKDPDLRLWLVGAVGTVAPRSGDETAVRLRALKEGGDDDAEDAAATPEAMLIDRLGVVSGELSRVRTREKDALRRAGDAERLAAELADARRTLEGVHRSVTFRVAHRGSLVARRLLPAGSGRRRVAGRVVRALSTRRADDGQTSGP